MMTYIWVRIMGVERNGKGQAAGNRDECIEEGSRSDYRLDCIRNVEIRQRLQQRSIVEVVKERRLNWRAKVREKPGSWVGKVLAGEVEGRIPQGRPRRRWTDDF